MRPQTPYTVTAVAGNQVSGCGTSIGATHTQLMYGLFRGVIILNGVEQVKQKSGVIGDERQISLYSPPSPLTDKMVNGLLKR